ncbi:hypothetical protein GLAREA_11623 [Glarea lozoyensis ATCC 20868]|uniref:Uncharacterized protein n=1 Tax=Glarea lozoyensis (strain ATCC 20868 / MF5171) TaxID=1116229 RepID=S3CEX0_GLAL2|nr:uncharacterized protein GLAREA_11623 [Glarea lozoyensis ATCC 20868]EPE25042.1 hypothetical protein GLAREA_11623 [Glarea lozoyensis ATCC 20868]
MISTPTFLRNSSPHRRYLSSRRSSARSSTSTSPAPSSPKLQAATLTLPTGTTRNSSYTSTPTSENGSRNGSNSGAGSELFSEVIGETDAQCWQRMLRIQREYHCYNSARLSAAVEAEERGETNVPVPSRLCLDLLNESLQSWIEAHNGGYVA